MGAWGGAFCFRTSISNFHPLQEIPGRILCQEKVAQQHHGFLQLSFITINRSEKHQLFQVVEMPSIILKSDGQEGRKSCNFIKNFTSSDC